MLENCLLERTAHQTPGVPTIGVGRCLGPLNIGGQGLIFPNIEGDTTPHHHRGRDGTCRGLRGSSGIGNCQRPHAPLSPHSLGCPHASPPHRQCWHHSNSLLLFGPGGSLFDGGSDSVGVLLYPPLDHPEEDNNEEDKAGQQQACQQWTLLARLWWHSGAMEVLTWRGMGDTEGDLQYGGQVGTPVYHLPPPYSNNISSNHCNH